jgi:hypothetical protein
MIGRMVFVLVAYSFSGAVVVIVASRISSVLTKLASF